MDEKKMHYFDQDKADATDGMLSMCIQQGYVPPTCLLSGAVVWSTVNEQKDPCDGCTGPREKCKGRAKP